MIIFITGNNSYLAKRRLDELVDEFVKKHGDLALERIDGEEADFSAILDAISGLPFLSKRKMVVARKLSATKPSDDQLEQIISSIPESNDLIIYEPVTDKRTSYYKFLKTKTNLETYDQIDSRDLSKWLVSEAKTKGGSLQLGDANYLVERIGPNQAMLASELVKLLLYNPIISRGSIDLLTEPNPQSKIFDLLDAAFSGNRQKALKIYQEQRVQKVESQAILAMIAWQLRVLALAVHAEGKSATEVAKDSGMNIYPVTKAFALAGKIDKDRIKGLVAEALDIDYRSKTTALDMDEALKTYITTI